MLRLVFWFLLFLNAALFAYAQGMLGTSAPKPGEREPAGSRPQVNRDKLRLLTSAEAEAAAKAVPAAPGADAAAPARAAVDAGTPPPATPAPAPAPAPAIVPAPKLACIDVGVFSASESRRFETRLAALDLGEKQSRQTVQAQDVSSYLVNIPPQGSKEAAERKAAELRNLGVTNFFIMSGDSPLKWAISLGVFKTESGAQALLAQLNKQGVHTARITPRGPQSTHFSYRFRDIDAATRERIVAMADAVSEAEARNCK